MSGPLASARHRRLVLAIYQSPISLPSSDSIRPMNSAVQIEGYLVAERTKSNTRSITAKCGYSVVLG
jgi:hypothetical protein